METRMFTLRMEKTLDKALEEAKWRLRKTKTVIIKEAIREYLQRHCPEVYEEFLNEQRQRGSET
ncbi:ribbon-helix-helix protein, CopG family [Desulfurobacterium thermolithotrophum]|uniref:ribbon-helix-helix protein, CopG family n=1 Tax=Desulfurobacterium thermolithotrophum TaxID=64160 RepID=UPI0013D6E524|nr:ribbon-helix-helix protein, CopG family [Desulfurobacterium thermolithotrophum]